MNFNQIALPFFLTTRLKLVASIILILVLSSCASTPLPQTYETPQKTHAFKDISFLSDQEKADLYEAIIAADIASAQGDHKTAVSFYLAAANISKDIDLIKLLVESANQAKDSLALLQAADIWLEVEPQSLNGLQLKISALLLMQDLKQAVAVSAQLFEQPVDSAKLTGLLNQITRNQSPMISNAYYLSLHEKYPLNLSLMTSQAYFLVRVAPQTKNPASIYQQAYRILDEVLNHQGNFLPAIELKTKLLYQSQQMEKAEAFLRQLAVENPKSSIINELLGQLLYDLRRYDLAIQHYNNWLKSHPDDVESHFYLAASLFAKGDYEKSLKHYQKILGKNYKPDLTYFFCGNTASQLKQYAQAIACYEAVSKGDYLTRSKIELAKIYTLTGQIDKALATLRNPQWATSEEAAVQLARIEVEVLDKHRDHQQAVDRLEEVLQQYPTSILLLMQKIRLNKLSKNPQAVLSLLEGGRNKLSDPRKVHPYNLDAASLLRSLNLFQMAIDWLNQALSFEPKDPDYLYARTLNKEPLGLYEDMIKDFEQLLSIDPDNANVKNALGYTLVDLNRDLDYARKLIDQAYHAMPDSPAVIDSKGWLAFREGAYQSALEYLHRAFQLAPNADVATHIGEVYWVMGEKDKAINFWQQAKSMDEENRLLKSTLTRLEVELK